MNLKELRIRAGKTQEEMAQEIRALGFNMTTQNYRNYEYGDYKNCTSALEKAFSQILGVDFTYNQSVK